MTRGSGSSTLPSTLHLRGVIGGFSTLLAHALIRIHAARPRRQFPCDVIVEAVLLSEGSIGSAGHVAQWLGLPNRFALARLLRREGVPSIRRLYGWVSVLSWVVLAEQTGLSLFQVALRVHRHPGACYRLVREVSGLSWRGIRARGSDWVEDQLMDLFTVED